MLEKLILKNYIPLKKKGVNSITITTKNIFNIVLGRNGYGKTSLLREMNPFPPENSDYDENGYKEIHYKIKNNSFILISKTGKNSQHQFILNGKNLNEGNTLLVQRDLVKHYFGISIETRNILTGIDRADSFSSLTPQRRKNVLMEINPNDTKYGLKVYEKARIALNQTKGALKHQRQRLTTELNRQKELKSLTPEELQLEINKLDNLIKEALILHGTLQHVEDQDLEPLIKKMGDIASQLFKNTDKTLYTASYYDQRIQTVQTFIESNKERQNGLQALIKNITEKIDNFNIPDGMTLKGYEDKINETNNSLNTLNKKRESFFEDNGWKEDHFKLVLDDLINLISNVEITEDSNLTAQGYINYQKSLKELLDKINNLEKEIDNLVHTLKHYENADNVKCPNCNSNFKIGFENIDPKKLKLNIQLLTDNLTNLKKEAKKIEELLERNEGWFETMGSLMRFIKHVKEPQYLLSIIKYFEVGKVTQNVLINILKIIKEYFELEKELEELISLQTTLKAQYQLMKESDLTKLNENYDSLSIKLGTTQREYRRLQQTLNYYNECKAKIEYDKQLVNEYKELFETFQNKLLEKSNYKIKVRVQEILSLLTPKKDKLLTDLIRGESLQSVINSIEENIKELEKREKHLKVIVDGLSPVKGLIGELMIDFLNSVCANVNACIEPIWTDPLRLQNCFIEGEDEELDLDYKFPVLTGSGKKPNDDIKKCSGGEKEIIDFMIRRVLLRYKGESCGIPLIMDEVGITFDELHRSRFISYINEQLRLDKLPQTFMISHYVNQYGSFNYNDVNIIALNTKGLTVPLEVNQNTSINE